MCWAGRPSVRTLCTSGGGDEAKNCPNLARSIKDSFSRNQILVSSALWWLQIHGWLHSLSLPSFTVFLTEPSLHPRRAAPTPCGSRTHSRPTPHAQAWATRKFSLEWVERTLARFVKEANTSPQSRTAQWLKDLGINDADPVKHEHAHPCDMLQMAMTYDQLDVSSLDVSSLDVSTPGSAVRRPDSLHGS